MNKTVMKVFLVIGVLLICLLVWALVFNEGGILQTAYNALVTPINNTWADLTGSPGTQLIPTWGSEEAGEFDYESTQTVEAGRGTATN